MGNRPRSHSSRWHCCPELGGCLLRNLLGGSWMCPETALYMACACVRVRLWPNSGVSRSLQGTITHIFHAVYRIMGERGLTVICVCCPAGSGPATCHPVGRPCGGGSGGELPGDWVD